MGADKEGEFSRQCSGAPGVSELELHISLCLPFKFSRCHLFMCVFLKKKKSKMITKQRLKEIQIAKQRRIQWHNWKRSLLDRNKVARVLIMANGEGRMGRGHGGLIVKITVSLGKSWQCGPPLPFLLRTGRLVGLTLRKLK